MRNTVSVFPSAIDDLIYFQNVNLHQLGTKNTFDSLFAAGHYTQASEVLNTANLDFYGASVFNLLENRLVNIENYVLTLDKNCFTAYQTTEPTGTDVTQNFIWIDG